MAITLEQTNTAPITWTTPQNTQTLPGGYSTKTGDLICLLLNVGQGGSMTITGCGATWGYASFGDTCACFGTGCTAGGTSITLGGSYTIGSNMDLVFAIFSGCGTEQGSVRSFGSGSSSTTPSLAATAGLVVGYGAGNGAYSSSSMSFGTLVHAYASDATRGAWIDYQVLAASQSLTYTANTSGATGDLALEFVSFNVGAPANTGNMLAVMGL